MSQAELLDTVSRWSLEQCKEAVDEVLPKLISYYEEEKTVALKANTLHILCSSFLPCLPLDHAEEKFFSKVMPKANMLFDEVLEMLKEDESELQELRLNSLQVANLILSGLNSCVEYLNTGTEILLQKMYSVPDIILHVLVNSYTHCKESERIYGKMLPVLTEPLGSFFRQACSLQMEYLMVLEKINVCSTHEKDVRMLTDACRGLSSLCQIVCSLDVKSTVALWKTYTKMITQHHKILLGKLEVVAEALQFLCEEIERGVQQIYSMVRQNENQKLDEKDFIRVVKIGNFNLKLVVTIYGKFQGYLGDCVQHLVHLILILCRLKIDTLRSEIFTKQQAKEIHSTIVVGIEPLLINLLPDKHFPRCVIGLKTTGLSSELVFPFCLLLCMVMEKLPDANDGTQDMWNAMQNPNLVSSLFTSFEQCYVEIYLPVHLPIVMDCGKGQKMVNFYEYACINVSTYAARLPARHFGSLEKQLLISLSGSPILARLASDVWYYLSRLGNASLCFSHCCILARLINSITPSSVSTTMKALLHRLAKLMTPEYKLKFIKKFLPQLHLSLWKDLPLSAFSDHPEVRNNLPDYIIESLQKKTMHLSSVKEFRTLCDEINLLSQLVTLKTNPALHKTALELIQKWHMKVSSQPFSVASSYITRELVQLATQLVPLLNGYELLQLVIFSQEMWKIGDNAVKATLLPYLRQWALKRIDPCPEQQEIICQVATLLGSSLEEGNFLFQQNALYTFSRVAHMTPHEEIITECGRIKPHLKDKIQNFLYKVPIDQCLKQGEIMSLLKKQKIQLSSAPKELNQTSNNGQCLKQDEIMSLLKKQKIQPPSAPKELNRTSNNGSHFDEVSSPPLKKPRKEDCSVQIQNIVKQIEANVQQLENLWNYHPHSEEMASELWTLSSRMLKLL